MALLDIFRTPSIFKSVSCPVPDDLVEVTTLGTEAPPEPFGVSEEEIEELWGHLVDTYKTGMHPAIQVCVRREGEVVLNRAIGYATGNGPADPASTEKRVVDLDTPINIFSASKAVTAMLVHKLAAQDRLHLDDWVSDYIPEFARHGKERITLRHVLAHRAGVPNLPPNSLDLDLLAHPDKVMELLCDAELTSRPGRVLAYHAVTGGFILGAVIERATGEDVRDVLRAEISEPLGLRWLNYGVAEEDVSEVARNALTGPPPPGPFGAMLTRALGASLDEVVELSNDSRFLTGVIPAGNVMTTAEEMAVFFQCLLDRGRWQGKQVFESRCVRHAVAEQSWWELDLTLFMPLRYGLGFMLGNSGVGPFGRDNEHAFGHIGLSNVFCWADPERDISVALLNTGKPVATPHVVPLWSFLTGISEVFPKIEEGARD
jgi:CubicO group peptidase (beta-lactamase class C family)